MNDIQKILSGERGNRQPQILDDEIARADIDSSLKYFIIFAAMGGGATFLFSYQLALFNNFPGLYEFVATCVTGIFLLMIAIFQSSMLKSRALSVILVCIESVGLLSFFFSSYSYLHTVGALVFIGLWYLGFVQGQKVLNETMAIRFYTFANVILHYSLIGFALFLSFLYAGIYRAGGSLSLDLYNAFLRGGAPVVRSFVPNFAPEMTVEGFFESFVEDRIDQYDEFAGKFNTPEEKKKTSQQIAADIRMELLKDTGALQKNESVAQYTYRILGSQFERLNERGLGVFVLIAIAALVFFPIRLILLILKWPILLIAHTVFAGLQFLGIIQILTEKRDKQLLTIR